MHKVLDQMTKGKRELLEILDSKYHKILDYDASKLLSRFAGIEFTTEMFTRE